MTGQKTCHLLLNVKYMMKYIKINRPAVVFMLLFLISCSPHTGSDADELRTETVEIKMFSFKPEVLKIPAGTKVVWINRDQIEHSVTHGTPEDREDKILDSGLFTKGEKYEFVFEEPGEYRYFCTRHNSMKGVVKVVAE